MIKLNELFLSLVLPELKSPTYYLQLYQKNKQEWTRQHVADNGLFIASTGSRIGELCAWILSRPQATLAPMILPLVAPFDPTVWVAHPEPQAIGVVKVVDRVEDVSVNYSQAKDVLFVVTGSVILFWFPHEQHDVSMFFKISPLLSENAGGATQCQMSWLLSVPVSSDPTQAGLIRCEVGFLKDPALSGAFIHLLEHDGTARMGLTLSNDARLQAANNLRTIATAFSPRDAHFLENASLPLSDDKLRVLCQAVGLMEPEAKVLIGRIKQGAPLSHLDMPAVGSVLSLAFHWIWVADDSSIYLRSESHRVLPEASGLMKQLESQAMQGLDANHLFALRTSLRARRQLLCDTKKVWQRISDEALAIMGHIYQKGKAGKQ